MSFSLGLSDIDSLTLDVQERKSRRLIGEAIAACRDGALRSTIVSTWIAVAYDIVAKARELAVQGEVGSCMLVRELDAAIEGRNLKKLQILEGELLTLASKDLELLASHEYAALKRLQEDRHLCAHPAFAIMDELYQISRSCSACVLSIHCKTFFVDAPLQGKSPIARFDADLVGPTFPTTAGQIPKFVRSKHLD